MRLNPGSAPMRWASSVNDFASRGTRRQPKLSMRCAGAGVGRMICIMKTSLTIALASMIACLGGCMRPKPVERHYEVVVKNDSSRAVTLWLTKDGPPSERGWRSPEQIAMRSGRIDGRFNGAVLMPNAQPLKTEMMGKFHRGSEAVLRMYAGQLSFDEILAVSRNSDDRADVMLRPGYNGFNITDRNGELMVVRADASADE